MASFTEILKPSSEMLKASTYKQSVPCAQHLLTLSGVLQLNVYTASISKSSLFHLPHLLADPAGESLSLQQHIHTGHH